MIVARVPVTEPRIQAGAADVPSDQDLAADRGESRIRLAAAAMAALACLAGYLGLAWDVQWHAAVGPDSFFTAPHALMYSGPAVTGLVALATVIRTTVRYYQGAAGVNDANTTPWLGYFHAPVGFVVAGLGALGFLVGGFFDLWWHTLYGFDVTLLSPAHFFLFLSMVAGLTGMAYAFASEANRARSQGQAATLPTVGFALMMALLLNLVGVFLFIGMYDAVVAAGLLVYPVAMAVIFPLVLVAASTFVQGFGGATLTAALFTILRVVATYWAPFMVEVLRRIDHLPYKVGAPLYSVPARSMPAYLLAFGLVIDLAVALARRYRLPQHLVAAGGAALATLLNFVLDPRWLAIFATWKENPFGFTREELLAQVARATVPSAVVAALVAALTGLLGAGFGKVLRYTDR